MYLSVALCLVFAMANADSILYMGSTETVDFDTASSRCAAFGGQLATFGSDAEFAALLAVRNALGVDAFIGLTDRDTEHHWGFVDGDTSFCQAQGNGQPDCDDISQWAEGQPDNWVGQGGQDCAQLWSTSIDDVACWDSRAFVCEFNGDNYASTSEGGAIYVARGDDFVDYATAKGRCAGIGGQLATFNGDAQFQAMLRVRNAIGHSAWIGMDDINQEHHWQFVDGDLSYCEPQGPGLDCDDIPQWASGQPDNYQGGQDCAQLWPSSIDDAPCGAALPYICEFNANTFATSDVVVGPASYFGDRPGQAPASYFVFEVTGLQGSGTLLLIFAMSLCIVCLSCLLCKNYKNYQSAHAKGYGKVVMDTESEL